MIKLREIMVDATQHLIADDGLALAGNIAFCMILALFPFLILLTAIAGFAGNQQLAETVIDYLLSVAPREIADPLSPEIHSLLTVPRTDILTIGALLTVWTASGAVESVRVGLNRAYEFTERRTYWFRLFQNALFVIGGALVLLVLALLIVFGPVLWGKVIYYLPAADRFTGWFHLLRYPISLSLVFVTLLLCHLFLPVARHRLTELLPGIGFTMVVWMAVAIGYAEYLASFSTLSSMYAGLTGFIIALTFLYLSAVLLIWGGEINQTLISIREAREQARTFGFRKSKPSKRGKTNSVK